MAYLQVESTILKVTVKAIFCKRVKILFTRFKFRFINRYKFVLFDVK